MTAFNSHPDYIVRVPMHVRLLGFQSPDSQWRQLSVTIDRYIWMAAAAINTPILSLKSLDNGESADIRLTELDDKNTLSKNPLPNWALPAAGAAWGLQEYGLATPGIKAVIAGDREPYVMLGSKAAVNVGTTLALRKITNWQIDKMKIARIGNYAQNSFCGEITHLSDTFTLLFGEICQLLALDCRSEEWVGLPFPEDLTLVICQPVQAPPEGKDTCLQRFDREYNQLSTHIKEFFPGMQSLRDLTEERLLPFVDQLPETLRMRAAFILQEDQRVMEAIDLLKWDQVIEFGALLDRSYEGIRELYESISPEIDALYTASLGQPGRIGGRPLTGIASCSLLFLVRDEEVEAFITGTKAAYQKATGSQAELIPYKTASMADIVPYTP